MTDDRHRHHSVAFGQTNATHTGGAARFEHADFLGREADRAAKFSDQHDVVILIGNRGVHQRDPFGQLHGNLAVAHHIGEIRQIVLAHIAVTGGKDDLQIFPFFLRHIHRHQRRNANPLGDGQDIDHGLALGSAARQRQTPGLHLVNHPIGREEQQRRVGVGHEKRGHHIIFFGLHGGQTLAAPVLSAEFGQIGALDIAARGDGDDHILALDQVLVVHIAGPIDNLGAARHGEHGFHLAQLVRNDRHDPVARA